MTRKMSELDLLFAGEEDGGGRLVGTQLDESNSVYEGTTLNK